MSRLKSPALTPAIIGFVIGIISVLAVGVLLIAVKVVNFTAATQTPNTSLSSNTIPAPTDTQLADSLAPQQVDTPTPSPFPSLMGTAEAHLEAGEGVAAIELLVPLLDQLSTAEELARLNNDLAHAEMLLGHFQRAAGYFEAAFALDPTPEVLLELASAYDLGGDLHTALARYLRLASWEEATETLRQVARDRARDIVSVLGTPPPRP